METVDSFCRQIRLRSQQNSRAMQAISGLSLHSIELGLLRQELDSMVRVLYLLRQDTQERLRLISLSEAGARWSRFKSNGELVPLTDAKMVNLASQLHGWAKNVYDFGCRAIHLSTMHDYGAGDPFKSLSEEERPSVVNFLKKYQDASCDTGSSFVEVAEYFPKVLTKITKNLEPELQRLQIESKKGGNSSYQEWHILGGVSPVHASLHEVQDGGDIAVSV